jgi:hypothetical protein
MAEVTTRERPILFSGPMVRAILAGTKTQTRRVVKNVVQHDCHGVTLDCIKDWDGGPSALIHAPRNWEICPHGVPGDRLWVRETWMPLWDSGAGFHTCLCPTGHEDKPDVIKFRADGEKPAQLAASWRPSIHMPRSVCRLTLEITDVRVQRLQDISESDAYAEGVTIPPEQAFVSNGNPHLRNEARCAFSDLWESINGPGSWAANPWVWAVSFGREVTHA